MVQKKRKHTLLYGLLYLFLIGLLIFSSGYWFLKSLKTTLNKETVRVEFPMGSSPSKIADILEENGVIKFDWIFKVQTMRKAHSSQFKAGIYDVPPKQELSILIDRIGSGDVVKPKTTKVTIPEGYTLVQIADRLNEEKVVDKAAFLKVAYNYGKDDFWFLKGIPVDEHRLDGFLFPDTYEFIAGDTPENIIYKMLRQFENTIEEDKDYILGKQLNSRDIVVAASLIEKEARHDEDRPKIASVIYNRLEKDMLLQIDATVLFVIGHKERVLYKDLEVDSPYNTYKYKGLPPSPISSPGKSSLKAALYPEKTDYLFYVANRETWYHHFAKTYKEHQDNIEKYWKN